MLHVMPGLTVVAASGNDFGQLIGLIVMIVLIIAANWPAQKKTNTPSRPTSRPHYQPPPTPTADRRHNRDDYDETDDADETDDDADRKPDTPRPFTVARPVPPPFTTGTVAPSSPSPSFAGRSPSTIAEVMAVPSSASTQLAQSSLTTVVETSRSAERAGPQIHRESLAREAVAKAKTVDGEPEPEAKRKAKAIKVVPRPANMAEAFVYAEVFGPPVSLRHDNPL